MKKLLIYFFLFIKIVVLNAQASDTTIFVCVDNLVKFTNSQYLGTTMRQHGVVNIVVDSLSDEYETIPSNYVFWPPYDTLPHVESFYLRFSDTGSVTVKSIDYDFGGLVLIKYIKYVVNDCRFPEHPGNDTIVVNTDNNNSGLIKNEIITNIVVIKNATNVISFTETMPVADLSKVIGNINYYGVGVYHVRYRYKNKIYGKVLIVE